MVNDFSAAMDISHALEGHGYRVDRAFNSQQAVAVYQSLQLHLIIVDIDMPRMEGLYLIRAVRSQGSHTPFIVITDQSGWNAIEDLHLRALGVLAVLPKPVSLKELVDLVASMLPDS